MAEDSAKRLDATDRADKRLSTGRQLPPAPDEKPSDLNGLHREQDRQHTPVPWYYSKMRIVYGLLALAAVAVYAWNIRFEVLPADAGYFVVDHWLNTVTFCTPPLSGIERQFRCSDPMDLSSDKLFFSGKRD